MKIELKSACVKPMMQLSFTECKLCNFLVKKIQISHQKGGNHER